MRKNYSSRSYELFLIDLKEEIRFSIYNQESIAKYLGINRTTLCKKMSESSKQKLSGRELYAILVLLGIL